LLHGSAAMNENHDASRMITSSKRGSSKLSASARKQKKKEQGRVSDFTKILNYSHQQNINHESDQQRLSHSHFWGAAPQHEEGSLGNSGSEDIMSFLDKQNGLENEATSSEGVLTQDLADINMDAIIQDHHNNSNSAKESSCSEGGGSSRSTQDMMISSTTDDNSASLTAVTQTVTNIKVNNNSNPNQFGRAQQALTRMGSIDSAASKPSPLTAKQKEQIEANRQRALRLKRLRQQTKDQQIPSNEAAQKPHPHEEVMRQEGGEIKTTTAARNPSQASTASSSKNVNAPIAPLIPNPLETLEATKRKSEASDVTSAGTDPSQ